MLRPGITTIEVVLLTEAQWLKVLRRPLAKLQIPKVSIWKAISQLRYTDLALPPAMSCIEEEFLLYAQWPKILLDF